MALLCPVQLAQVPWQASLQDVVNFLAEYQIPPQLALAWRGGRQVGVCVCVCLIGVGVNKVCGRVVGKEIGHSDAVT